MDKLISYDEYMTEVVPNYPFHYVAFLSKTCGWCKKYMPELIEAYQNIAPEFKANQRPPVFAVEGGRPYAPTCELVLANARYDAPGQTRGDISKHLDLLKSTLDLSTSDPEFAKFLQQ